MSALEKYGTFHPKLLFAPVIERAKEGWTLGKQKSQMGANVSR